MRSHGHQQWRTLLLAAGVILVGTTNSMSRELLPYAQAVEELGRVAIGNDDEQATLLFPAQYRPGPNAFGLDDIGEGISRKPLKTPMPPATGLFALVLSGALSWAMAEFLFFFKGANRGPPKARYSSLPTLSGACLVTSQ